MSEKIRKELAEPKAVPKQKYTFKSEVKLQADTENDDNKPSRRNKVRDSIEVTPTLP